MSYSDFTLDLHPKRLGVTVREGSLFPVPGGIEPSAWLKELEKILWILAEIIKNFPKEKLGEAA